MSGRGTGPDPMWLADAARLIRMIQQAAGSEDGAHTAATAGAGAAHAGAAPECRFCPVCQAIALVRRSGPDVLEQVAAAALGLAAALREADAGADPGVDTGAADGAAEGDAYLDVDAVAGDGPEPGAASGAGEPASTSPAGPGRRPAAAPPRRTVPIDITD